MHSEVPSLTHSFIGKGGAVAHRIHLDGRYEGRDLSIRACEVDGGFKLVSQLTRKRKTDPWGLVVIESPDEVYLDRASARAAAYASLKLHIDGGFA